MQQQSKSELAVDALREGKTVVTADGQRLCLRDAVVEEPPKPEPKSEWMKPKEAFKWLMDHEDKELEDQNCTPCRYRFGRFGLQYTTMDSCEWAELRTVVFLQRLGRFRIPSPPARVLPKLPEGCEWSISADGLPSGIVCGAGFTRAARDDLDAKLAFAVWQEFDTREKL